MGNLNPNNESVANPDYEPLNIGFFVDRTWYLCWPNVIGRSWAYQENYSEKALKIENGEKVENATEEDNWYMDLLSKNPHKTLKALEAEGFIYLANADAAEENWEKWFFTKIIVRTRSQPVSIEVQAGDCSDTESNKYCAHEENGYSRKNIWNDKINGTGHFVVLTIPPKPNDPALFSVALSDYKASNKIYPMC